MSLQTRDTETGLINKQTIYHLNEIGQAIVFAIQNHEERINNHDDRIEQLEKTVALLTKELQRRDAEELAKKQQELPKEFEF